MTADRKREIYSGEWERGRMHGRGIYYYSAVSSTTGDDGKNKKKGNASLSNPGIQSYYEGEFRDGAR